MTDGAAALAPLLILTTITCIIVVGMLMYQAYQFIKNRKKGKKQ